MTKTKTMKLIIAIIKPFKMDDVLETLADIDLKGITITEVKGFGRQKGQRECYRGVESVIDLLPKLKLEMAVPSDEVDDVIKLIRNVTHSGKLGDGKIFVLDLEQVVRIRTGELGGEAL